MEKIFLLPNGFKKVGWIILVPTFVLGVLMTIDGYNGFHLSCYPNGFLWL